MAKNVVKIQAGIDGSSPPGVTFDEMYEQSVTQQFQIGQRVCMSNGCVFHYAKANEDLTNHTICAGPDVASTEEYGLILGSGTTAAYGGAVGAKKVKVVCSDTAITENQFQGGQYIINSHSASLNSTQNLFIKSNPAAATRTVCELTLHTPLIHTVDSRAKGALLLNPFYGVQPYAATPENYPVGLTNINVTSKYYFWLQTWGPCGARCSAAPPGLGGCVTAGSTGGGLVTSGVNLTLYPIVGMNGPWIGVSGEMTAMFLTIMP